MHQLLRKISFSGSNLSARKLVVWVMQALRFINISCVFIQHKELSLIHIDVYKRQVVLYTYEPQRKQLYSDPVTIGIRNPNAVARIQQRILRTSLVSELLQKREARWIENVSDDPRFAQSYFVMMEEIASTAALPLTFGNMILGVIFVGYRKRHHFSQHDQEMLQLLVDQAATTIRNDQLLEEKKYLSLIHI